MAEEFRGGEESGLGADLMDGEEEGVENVAVKRKGRLDFQGQLAMCGAVSVEEIGVSSDGGVVSNHDITRAEHSM